MARTGNGDFAYDSTGSALLEFFSKAGSILKGKKGEKRESYYGNESTALKLFKPAWTSNKYKSMQLAHWCRDILGGAGNRQGFRDILKWLASSEEGARWVEANMHFIPEIGRWDDLESLIGTSCEKNALEFWVTAIQEGHGLAAKWAPREDKDRDVFHKLRKIADMSPKEFRKLLVKYTNVVESVMCKKEWASVDYNKIPSVAIGRYNNTFKKYDTARYDQWKLGLEKGVDVDGNVVKVNAGAIFPHDLIKTLKSDCNSGKLVDAQFAALPNYMEGTKMRIMPICDFSGSMDQPIGGGISTALDVSMALGLYCSDRVGEKNPFYRKFIPFSNTSKLVDWKNDTFSKAVSKTNNGWCGSTNIRAALSQILQDAQMFNATDEQIPNVLLIISDMQFNDGATESDETTVETGLRAWEKAGYTRPKVVYWNTAGYDGAPATSQHRDVGLVSGFSPSILTAILGGEDFTPVGIMNRAIKKYKIVDPDKAEEKVIKKAELKAEVESNVVEPKKRVEKSRKKLKASGISAKK